MKNLTRTNSLVLTVDPCNSTLNIGADSFRIEREPFENSWMARFKSGGEIWFIKAEYVEQILENYNIELISEEVEFLEFEYEEWEEEL